MNDPCPELRFRRQFLLTPNQVTTLPTWTHTRLSDLNLVTHPELAVTVWTDPEAQRTLALLGFALDPHAPNATDADILARLGAAWQTDGGEELLSGLSGRYVLVVADADETVVYHDAMGLRTVEYTRVDGRTHVASQARLLAEVVPVADGERMALWRGSREFAENREASLPSGVTLFENVEQLVPNHRLHLSTGTQERYWPIKPIPAAGDTTEAAVRAMALLRASFTAAAHRAPLALSLTSGFDSRLAISATADVRDRLTSYTLLYRSLSAKSPDVSVAKRLAEKVGIPHTSVPCRDVPTAEWIGTYRENTALAHPDDWGFIAYGIQQGIADGLLSEDALAVKGSCGELIRGRYWDTSDGTPRPPKLDTADDVFRILPGWEEFDFATEAMRDWFDKAKPVAAASGYGLDDLLYWEHDCGSWSAQSQLEWEIVQDVFTPVNNREFLSLVLSVPIAERVGPDYSFFRTMMTEGGLDVLSEPINPTTRLIQIRSLFDRITRRLQRDMRKTFSPSWRAVYALIDAP